MMELLIVLSALIVLAVFIYPIFSGARDNARPPSCLNNQRKIALNIQMFAQDNDETLPSAATVWQNIKLDKGDLHCPQTGKDTGISYGYNIFLSNIAIGNFGDLGVEVVTADARTHSHVVVSGMTGSETLHNTLTAPGYPNVIYQPSDCISRHTDMMICSYLDGHCGISKIGPESEIAWVANVDCAPLYGIVDISIPTKPIRRAYKPDEAFTGSTLMSARTLSAPWSAHARGKQAITNGTLYWKYPAEGAVAIGLYYKGDPEPRTLADFAYVAAVDGTSLSIYEHADKPVSTNSAYPPYLVDTVYLDTDTFSIERDGVKIIYRKNGKAIFTASMPTAKKDKPMFVAALFNTPGVALSELRYTVGR